MMNNIDDRFLRKVEELCPHFKEIDYINERLEVECHHPTSIAFIPKSDYITSGSPPHLSLGIPRSPINEYSELVVLYGFPNNGDIRTPMKTCPILDLPLAVKEYFITTEFDICYYHG